MIISWKGAKLGAVLVLVAVIGLILGLIYLTKSKISREVKGQESIDNGYK